MYLWAKKKFPMSGAMRKYYDDTKGCDFKMFNHENEKLLINDENFNKKILTGDGVCLFFSKVFDQTGKNRLPTIKPKLKKILVDFGLVQTCVEINQKLNFIKVWYIDEQAVSLKGLLLQRFNQSKSNQAIELSISLEGSLVVTPDKSGKVKTYSGLTKFLFQEFIQPTKSSSMIDDDPFNEIKTIIQKGNLAPTMPLESIFRGELDEWSEMNFLPPRN